MKKHICSILLYSLLLSPTIHSHESRIHENHIEDLSIEPIPIIKGFIKGTFYSFAAPLLLFFRCKVHDQKHTDNTASSMANPISMVCAAIFTFVSAYDTSKMKTIREELKNLSLDSPQWKSYIEKWKQFAYRERIYNLTKQSNRKMSKIREANPAPNEEDRQRCIKKGIEQLGSAPFNENVAFFAGTVVGSITQAIVIKICTKNSPSN